MKLIVKHMTALAISFEGVHYNVRGKRLSTVKYIEKIEKEETFLYIPSPLKMTDQFWFKNNLVVQTPEVKNSALPSIIF